LPNQPSTPEQFASDIPFDRERVHAVAVYCSDGRLGEHCDDFIVRGLNLPRYDRLAVPGGAACLAGHFYTYREEEGVTEQLRFLAKVHRIERVVLIAHEGCAFYSERLRVSPLQLETQQLEDMQKAVRRVRSFGMNIDVSAYFARLRDASVLFERVQA
jgi:hypothetical protein